jgi:hypothetical protein
MTVDEKWMRIIDANLEQDGMTREDQRQEALNYLLDRAKPIIDLCGKIDKKIQYEEKKLEQEFAKLKALKKTCAILDGDEIEPSNQKWGEIRRSILSDVDYENLIIRIATKKNEADRLKIYRDMDVDPETPKTQLSDKVIPEKTKLTLSESIEKIFKDQLFSRPLSTVEIVEAFGCIGRFVTTNTVLKTINRQEPTIFQRTEDKKKWWLAENFKLPEDVENVSIEDDAYDPPDDTYEPSNV